MKADEILPSSPDARPPPAEVSGRGGGAPSTESRLTSQMKILSERMESIKSQIGSYRSRFSVGYVGNDKEDVLTSIQEMGQLQLAELENEMSHLQACLELARMPRSAAREELREKLSVSRARQLLLNRKNQQRVDMLHAAMHEKLHYHFPLHSDNVHSQAGGSTEGSTAGSTELSQS